MPNLESVGYYDRDPGCEGLPPGFGLAAPRLVKQIPGRHSAGAFVMVVHRPDSAPIARTWPAAAKAAGLRSVVHQDNRYTAAGWRLQRLVSLGWDVGGASRPVRGVPSECGHITPFGGYRLPL